MTTVTVPLSEAMQGWIDDRIEEGEFASTADYLLDGEIRESGACARRSA